MTLEEVLQHVFTNEDLDGEVTNYSVLHTLNSNSYDILSENGRICISVVKTNPISGGNVC